MDETVLTEDVGFGHTRVVDVDVVGVECTVLLVVEEVDVSKFESVGSDELSGEVEHGRCRGGIVEEHNVLVSVVFTKLVETWRGRHDAIWVIARHNHDGVVERLRRVAAAHLALGGTSRTRGSLCRREHGGGVRVVNHRRVEQQLLLRQGEFVVTAHAPIVGGIELGERVIVGDEQCSTTGLGQNLSLTKVVNQMQVVGVVSVLLHVPIDVLQP